MTQPHYTVAPRPAPPIEDRWDGAYWSAIESLAVDCFHPRSSDHRPATRVKLTHSSQAIHAFFQVRDRYVLCRHLNLNDSVCLDSCVEFFVQPRPAGPYFNVETNCGGTLLMSYIEDWRRTESGFAKFTMIPPDLAARIAIRTSLGRPVWPEIADEITWTVRCDVPLPVLEHFAGALGPLDGQTWRANFYKCADRSSHPHWGSWAPIGEHLNFHQPDRFAPITFAGL